MKKPCRPIPLAQMLAKLAPHLTHHYRFVWRHGRVSCPSIEEFYRPFREEEARRRRDLGGESDE